MRRVIVESPYSSGTPVSIRAVVERNLRYLRACLRDCILRGESPYASHGLLTQEGVLDDNDPKERELGIEAGFAWREAADLTVFYVDLGWSRGMVYGRAHTEKLSRPLEQRWLGAQWGECLCHQPLSSDHLYHCPCWRAAP